MPRRTKIGRVVSTAMANTIVVEVERLKQHRRYKKYIRVRKKLMAHDVTEQAVVGDTVRIAECPPVSKRKRWELMEIVTRGVGPEVELKPEAGVEEMLRARKEVEEAAAEADKAEVETVLSKPPTSKEATLEEPQAEPETNEGPVAAEPPSEDEEVAAE